MKKLLFFLIIFNWCNVFAQEKVALIVGNNNYKEYPLKNAANDADLMKKTLEDLGFTVQLVKDASKSTFEQSLKSFNKTYRNADIRFFYYAGHGIQFEGENYLIPVDATMEEKEDVKLEGINFSTIFSIFQSSRPTAMNIFVMDACRNNPFKGRSWGSRGEGDRGLVLKKTDFNTGSYAAFSADNGQKASDGDKNNGLYTSVLAEEIKRPGVEINILFQQVRNKVVQLSKGEQIPVEENRLLGEGFYFIPKANTVTPKEIIVVNDDRDGDGFADKVDKCPNDFSKTNNGCPELLEKEDYIYNAVKFKLVDIPGTNYRVGKYEVTIGQYLAFCKATNSHWPEWLKEGSSTNIYTGNHRIYSASKMSESNIDFAVTGVTWYDADAFCKWMGGRLPTEKEWDYVAKAGTSNKYAGSNNLKEVGWYDKNSFLKDNGDAAGSMGVHPVGMKKPNAFGIYDMSGNVSEWTNSVSKDDSQNKIIKGGDWYSWSDDCLIKNYQNMRPSSFSFDTGFRIVVEK